MDIEVVLKDIKLWETKGGYAQKEFILMRSGLSMRFFPFIRRNGPFKL